MSTVPARRLGGTLPEPAPGQTNGETLSGEHFIQWLRQGIQLRRLIFNDVKALMYTIADSGYLVSPEVFFQRYAQEHPQVAALAKQDEVSGWR